MVYILLLPSPTTPSFPKVRTLIKQQPQFLHLGLSINPRPDRNRPMFRLTPANDEHEKILKENEKLKNLLANSNAVIKYLEADIEKYETILQKLALTYIQMMWLMESQLELTSKNDVFKALK
ncbi:hypothetical protein L195_g056968 [Trifolium pratense]|uniref:Uncharacterized protein n=1 Tax=Trifolium pratense TaxID=57577 RepID=A0A2K3KUE9_TRIPR|nr:hypothetical protein L195_g056968 [Trifolium pratense]